MHLSASMHCANKAYKTATFFLNQRITAMLTVSTQKLNAFILKVNFVAQQHICRDRNEMSCRKCKSLNFSCL